MWVVVKFIEGEEIEVLPDKWLLSGDFAYYPQYGTKSKIEKAIKNEEEPNPLWQKYKVKLMSEKRYTSFFLATSKATKACHMSDISDRENYIPEKRQPKKRVLSDSTSENSSTSLENFPSCPNRIEFKGSSEGRSVPLGTNLPPNNSGSQSDEFDVSDLQKVDKVSKINFPQDSIDFNFPKKGFSKGRSVPSGTNLPPINSGSQIDEFGVSNLQKVDKVSKINFPHGSIDFKSPKKGSSKGSSVPSGTNLPPNNSGSQSDGFNNISDLQKVDRVSKGINEDNFQKKVVGYLVRIRKVLNDHEIQMGNIESKIDKVLNILLNSGELAVNNNQVIDSQVTDILKKLPVHDNDDFTKYDNELEDDNTFKLLVIKLKRLGGTNFSDHIKRILKRMMTDELMQNFSLSGHKGKKRFISTNFYKAIKEAVQAESVLTTEKEIEVKISIYLSKAKERFTYKPKKVVEVDRID